MVAGEELAFGKIGNRQGFEAEVMWARRPVDVTDKDDALHFAGGHAGGSIALGHYGACGMTGHPFRRPPTHTVRSLARDNGKAKGQ